LACDSHTLLSIPPSLPPSLSSPSQTRCRYDSSNKETETHYGPGIKDEMCLGILFYYPAQKLGSTSLACMDLDGKEGGREGGRVEGLR
jgi:hypothetical protein